MIQLLLVEDDQLIVNVITYYLKETGGYQTTVAMTAGEALSFAKRSFDVILLDIMLPDANGIELCEYLRKWHDCPIIFISALDNADTIVQALASGGDDFLTKPFDNKVLDARIKANLRRYKGAKAAVPSAEALLERDGFRLDPERHQLTHGEQAIRLSSIEFRILFLLMQNPGKCYTPREIYETIWSAPSAGDTRTVLVHIHNLRQKLEDNPNEPKYLKLIWGSGYTFDTSGS